MAIQQFQPINYAGMSPAENPASGFMRGLQLVQGFQTLQQQAEERKLQIAKMEQEVLAKKAAAERRKLYESDLASALANPTADAFASVVAKHPEQLEAIKGSWGMLEKGQRDAEFLAGTQAFNALENGNPQAAKGIIQERITAMKNSGKDPTKLEAMLSTLDADPTKAQAQLGLILSAVEPDQWKKMADEKRAAEQAPADLQIKNANAVIKKIEADTAPQKYQLDLDKQRADLAKTLTDTEMNDATRRKTLAEIAAIDAKRKAISSGKIPVEDRPEWEKKLRDEYVKNTTGFSTVQEAYRRVSSASDNAAGDLSLVFGYMKVLDPGSTVREGEQAQVSNAAGVSDRIRNIYNRVASGERLSPAQRAEFKKEAEKLYGAAGVEEKKVRAGIERIAKGYGLNTENVFYYPKAAGEARQAVDIAGNPIALPPTATIVKGDK